MPSGSLPLASLPGTIPVDRPAVARRDLSREVGTTVVRIRGGVLFDIDGTLLLGSTTHLGVLGATLGRHLGREIRFAMEGEHPLVDGIDVAGWIDVQVARAVLAAHAPAPAPESTVEALMSEFEADYRLAVEAAEPPRVVAGAAACLERLADAGIPLGLVTGNASFVARLKLASVGLDRFFRFERDLGFGDWRENRSAIAPAAARALVGPGGDVASVTMVGDTPSDMRAARAAGVRPIGVLSGAGTAESLLGAGAGLIIGSVADLRPEDELAPA